MTGADRKKADRPALFPPQGQPNQSSTRRKSTDDVKVFGRYLLGEEIGSGGMASVYLARRTDSHADEWTNVIKLMHPHLARDAEEAARFQDEGRIAQRINHPYVCRVFEAGVSDEGIPYMVMERLVGQPLSRLITALRDDPEKTRRSQEHYRFAARLVSWLCEGLHSVHELRDDRDQPLEIVHRDVTPQNIFVLADGSVRLLDFGIARGKHRLLNTQTDSLRGKAPYMAPEYLLSEAFDRRIDVWSLGVVLWELLTLRPLFGLGANELQTLNAIVSSAVPVPSTVRPEIPAALDLIVARAGARDPRARFPTAQAFGHALEQWLSGTSPLSRREVALQLQRLFPGTDGSAARPLGVGLRGPPRTLQGVGSPIANPTKAPTQVYPALWGSDDAESASEAQPAARPIAAPPDAVAHDKTIEIEDPYEDETSAFARRPRRPLAKDFITMPDGLQGGPLEAIQIEEMPAGSLMSAGGTLISATPKLSDLLVPARPHKEARVQVRPPQLPQPQPIGTEAARAPNAAPGPLSRRRKALRLVALVFGASVLTGAVIGLVRSPMRRMTTTLPGARAQVPALDVEIAGSEEVRAWEPTRSATAEREPEAPVVEPPVVEAPVVEPPVIAPPVVEARPEPAPARREAPVHTAAAARTQPSGEIEISYEGGVATVWNGSEYLGETPLHARLPAGTYNLVLRPPTGGRDLTVIAVVSPGAPAKLRVAAAAAGQH